MRTPAAPPPELQFTICVEIGNSDDKLSQSRWADFCTDTNGEIEAWASQIYGVRHSDSDSPWQNACWHFRLGQYAVNPLAAALSGVAYTYGQDSIAWSVMDDSASTMIKPGPPDPTRSASSPPACDYQ